MYMKGKFRLQKIAALSLVFVLLMNTLTAALAPVFAMEMDTIPNVLMDVGITDEAGNILDESQVEAGGISSSDKVLIHYDWSLAGVTVQKGDSYTFQLPMQLEIKEQQQGSLLSGNQTEIATYQVELDGSVAIQFNEA
ncbi:MAG: Ig-like domain-containing protein, partial [Trichococcus sp.]